MFIPPEIIDNSEGNRLVSFLKKIMQNRVNTDLDIATAFFDIKAYSLVKDELHQMKNFRLLIGKEADFNSERTLGEILTKSVKQEVEGFDLTPEKVDVVKSLIEFLKRSSVEVRLYDKQFLHGKAYIFDKLVVIGSSNFTGAGLTSNTELNSVKFESSARYTREEWFEKFWKDGSHFKYDMISILESSRFGSSAYSPYQVYIKSLFELQRDDIILHENDIEKRTQYSSQIELTQFQQDAVDRVFSRLRKYGSILIADSVGLGKTWIAKKVIEYYGRLGSKRFLIVCPAQLKGMWKKELKDIMLTDSIISQEEIASKDYLDRAKNAVGVELSNIELIVVDESHNFRNPLSNRWENLFTLIHDSVSNNGKNPYLLFLTATPINNTIWDLYFQIMLLVHNNRKAFVKEGITDLLEFFKYVDKIGDPSLLNDLLNEISIRRTRDYIKKNYPDAELNGQRILFPQRIPRNINYRLDPTYKGMYRKISDAIMEDLTLSYYRLLDYKKAPLTVEEELLRGRMIALDGIFRTILLKRLESSVEAFRTSINKQLVYLNALKDHLKQGEILTKETFLKYILHSDNELDDYRDELRNIKLEDYYEDRLFKDIDKDIEIFKQSS